MKMLQRAEEKNLFPKTLSLVSQHQDHQQISVKRQLLGQQKYSNVLVSALE